MNISWKPILAACAAGTVALTLFCISVQKHTTSSSVSAIGASIEETDSGLKVFVGDIDGAPDGYIDERAAYLENVAKTDENKVMKALISLDDYYSVDEISTLAKKYDIAINRAYMWPRGETGRLSLYVENGDIDASLEAYKKQVAEDSSCDQDVQFTEYHQRLLNGEYGIFALTVTASAEALADLNAEVDCVSYVDVMYNPEVEAYAEQVGKAVSYIELPAKPDGAL